MNWFFYATMGVLALGFLALGVDRQMSLQACQKYHTADICEYALR